MTRILYMSDLHIDVSADYGKHILSKLASNNDQYDMIVLAGDVSNTYFETATFLKDLMTPGRVGKVVPVVFVPGNHEYYTFTMEEANKAFASLSEYYERRGLFILGDGVGKVHASLDGIDFFGTTLWTDTAYHYDIIGAAHDYAARYMSDFSRIVKNDRVICPSDYQRMFYDERDRIRHALTGVLNSDENSKKCMVSHHAPHGNSVHPKYENHILTGFFASKIADVSDTSYATWTRHIDLWFHGHMHDSFDYMIDHGEGYATRVLCNPLGYRDHKRKKFENADFQLRIVEV